MGLEKKAEKKIARTATGKVFVLLALIGLTALVVAHFTDARTLWATLKTGDPFWIFIGLAIHVLFFVGYALLYKLGFDAVGVRSKTLPLVPVVMAAVFVNAVIPSGGAAAAALFIDDAARRRESGTRATIGVVLVLLADLMTLIPFILWGVVFLVRSHDFKTYDLVGAILFFSYITLLIVMLAVAYRSESRLVRGCRVVARVINRIGAKFGKGELLSDEWCAKTGNQLSAASRTMVHRPKQLALLSGWALVLHAINLYGLWALVKAYGQLIPLGGLIAAFGMGIIFFVIAVIPEGVAVVEAVMTLVFSSVGMSVHTAIAITMVFRGVNFWLPLAIGIFTFGRIRRFGQRDRNPAAEEQAA